MPEPKQLKIGKEFQKIVQKDFAEYTKDGVALSEKRISFVGLESARKKSGRMDILIYKDDNKKQTVHEKYFK